MLYTQIDYSIAISGDRSGEELHSSLLQLVPNRVLPKSQSVLLDSGCESQGRYLMRAIVTGYVRNPVFCDPNIDFAYDRRSRGRNQIPVSRMREEKRPIVQRVHHKFPRLVIMKSLVETRLRAGH